MTGKVTVPRMCSIVREMTVYLTRAQTGLQSTESNYHSPLERVVDSGMPPVFGGTLQRPAWLECRTYYCHISLQTGWLGLLLPSLFTLFGRGLCELSPNVANGNLHDPRVATAELKQATLPEGVEFLPAETYGYGQMKPYYPPSQVFGGYGGASGGYGMGGGYGGGGYGMPSYGGGGYGMSSYGGGGYGMQGWC